MEDKREFLETKASQARELALTAIASFGNGHVGGSMSIMDALAVLFYDAMRLDDQDPDWPHQKLDNLTVLLDYNKGQVDGFVADIEAVAPHEPKWEAFGWDVQRVDGHDVLAAAAVIEKAKTVSGKPQLIVLDTVKGKGFVPFEGKPSTHSIRQGFFSCRRCTRPTPAPAQSAQQQPSVSPAASRTGCCAAAPIHGRSFTSAIRPGSWTSRASVIWRPELRSWTSLLFTVQPEQSWTDWCTFRSAAWRTELLPARR